MYGFTIMCFLCIRMCTLFQVEKMFDLKKTLGVFASKLNVVNTIKRLFFENFFNRNNR